MPNQIIYRKAENEVWICETTLLKLLPQLSSHYLRVKARPQFKQSVQSCQLKRTWLPNTGKSWRFSKIENNFYYEYDSIPNKAPSFYQSQLPKRSELIAGIAEEKTHQTQQDLTHFLNNYLYEHQKEFYPLYTDCTKAQQENLSKAAALLQAAIDYTREFNVCTSRNDFFISFTGYLRADCTKYLPHNYRCFKQLFARTTGSDNTKLISEIIKLPRSGNNNAVKFSNDTEIESWIFQMRWSGKNYTNAHIERKVKFMCSITGKREPSREWIANVLADSYTKYLTASTRFGSKGRHGQMYQGYIPTANALNAGDCWQVDGTRVNFIDFKLNGKNVFLYIVAVRDVHSGDILGYSFDLSENRWSIHNALKMAADEAGYLPYELVFDRFPGHNTPEIKSFISDLENKGVKVTITHNPFGKAHIERWFSTLQQVFMQDSDYYYGEGVQSRNPFAHRSKEELLRMKRAATADGWDFDKSCNEACRLIEAYRNTKLSYYSRKFKHIEFSPKQLHEHSEKLNVINIDTPQTVYLFGLRKPITPRNEGLIKTDINTVPFNYRIADNHVISHYTGKQVLMCYSLDNLDEVYLYELSDKPLKKFLGVAKEEVAPQMYGPNADFARLQNRKSLLKNLEEERIRQLNMKLAAGSEVSLLLNGSVSKHEVEDAETSFLNQSFSNDADDLNIDITDQY